MKFARELARALSIGLYGAVTLSQPTGCSSHDSPCWVSAQDYEQACATDDDCIAVQLGNLCARACEPENAAINRQSLPAYELDKALALQSQTGRIKLWCGSQPVAAARCQRGSCTPSTQ